MSDPTRLPWRTPTDVPRDIDLDAAKAAIEQVNKRLEAELALKTSTETRALALATQCTTLLAAVAGATLVELTGSSRVQLVHAGFVGAVSLLAAVLCAHRAARPSSDLYLPGRLPDELWDDLVAPSMKGPEFMVRIVAGLQEAMVANEKAQALRARWLSRALNMVILAPLFAMAAAATPALGMVERVNQTWGAARSEYVLHRVNEVFSGGLGRWRWTAERTQVVPGGLPGSPNVP